MWHNDISDDEMLSAADGLQHNKSLTKLCISQCKFSVKGSYIATVVYKMQLCACMWFFPYHILNLKFMDHNLCLSQHLITNILLFMNPGCII